MTPPHNQYIRYNNQYEYIWYEGKLYSTFTVDGEEWIEIPRSLWVEAPRAPSEPLSDSTLARLFMARLTGKLVEV